MFWGRYTGDWTFGTIGGISEYLGFRTKNFSSPSVNDVARMFIYFLNLCLASSVKINTKD